MFGRLRDNWVYGGVLAGVILLALTPVLARDWPFSILLNWLQLPVYQLHQYEEHDADHFRAFVNATIGAGQEVLTREGVFTINILGVWGVDALAFAQAPVAPGLGLIAVYLSLVNGLAHFGPALATRTYNPGLVTSVLLFLPLGLFTVWVLRDLGPSAHLTGLAVSLAIHGVIILHTLGRKSRLTAG